MIRVVTGVNVERSHHWKFGTFKGGEYMIRVATGMRKRHANKMFKAIGHTDVQGGYVGFSVLTEGPE